MRRTAIIVGGVVALTIVLMSVCVVAVGYVLERRAALSHHGPTVYDPAAHPKENWRGTAVETESEPEEESESSKLPSVARDIPVFQPRLLDGCSKSDLDAVEKSINDAIAIGAPLYNDGDFSGCYATYESAARSIERASSKTCKGPAGALAEGRARAAKRTTAAESAWAMRDAFDGILDVMDRRGAEL